MTNTVNNKIGNIDERYAKQGYDKLDQKGREVVHNLADETGGLDSKVCTDYLQRVNSGSLTPLPHQFDTAKFCIKNDLYEPLGYLQNEIGFNNVSDYLIYHASHANQPGYVKKFHQQYGLTKVTYEVGGKAATKEIAAYLMDNNILILPDYNGICDEEKTTLSDHPYNRHPIYNLFIQNDNELPSDYMYTEYFDYIKQNTDKDILKHIMQWTARTICKGGYIGIRSKRIRELFTSRFDQYWERKNYMRCLFYTIISCKTHDFQSWDTQLVPTSWYGIITTYEQSNNNYSINEIQTFLPDSDKKRSVCRHDTARTKSL